MRRPALRCAASVASAELKYILCFMDLTPLASMLLGGWPKNNSPQGITVPVAHPWLFASLSCAALLAFCPAATAGAIHEPTALEFPIGPVDGGSMVVHENGVVRITFLGSDAGYFNELYLESDDPSTSDRLVFDRTTRYGRTFVLGNFDAGTVLTFRLHVRNTGDDFFTGDASTNPDGIAHARATTVYDPSLDLPVTMVGFEDLTGGGDRDFNDFMFRLTNVVDPPAAPTEVPEPHGVALAGLGLVVLAARRRRVRG